MVIEDQYAGFMLGLAVKDGSLEYTLIGMEISVGSWLGSNEGSGLIEGAWNGFNHGNVVDLEGHPVGTKLDSGKMRPVDMVG